MSENLYLACWFGPCPEPAVFEAIGRCDDVFCLETTVPMTLCERHADLVADLVVVLRAS